MMALERMLYSTHTHPWSADHDLSSCLPPIGKQHSVTMWSPFASFFANFPIKSMDLQTLAAELRFPSGREPFENERAACWERNLAIGEKVSHSAVLPKSSEDCRNGGQTSESLTTVSVTPQRKMEGRKTLLKGCRNGTESQKIWVLFLHSFKGVLLHTLRGIKLLWQGGQMKVQS